MWDGVNDSTDWRTGKVHNAACRAAAYWHSRRPVADEVGHARLYGGNVCATLELMPAVVSTGLSRARSHGVWECCKGDHQSQWERLNFDPQPTLNPLTDRHQITSPDYVADIYHQTKFGLNPCRVRFAPCTWNVHPQPSNVYFTFFLVMAARSLRWEVIGLTTELRWLDL